MMIDKISYQVLSTAPDCLGLSAIFGKTLDFSALFFRILINILILWEYWNPHHNYNGKN